MEIAHYHAFMAHDQDVQRLMTDREHRRPRAVDDPSKLDTGEAA